MPPPAWPTTGLSKDRFRRWKPLPNLIVSRERTPIISYSTGHRSESPLCRKRRRQNALKPDHIRPAANTAIRGQTSYGRPCSAEPLLPIRATPSFPRRRVMQHALPHRLIQDLLMRFKQLPCLVLLCLPALFASSAGDRCTHAPE